MGGAARCGRCRRALPSRFNAARGFVGGAAESVPESYPCRTRFNAARGFVGGAACLVMYGYVWLLCFNAARGFVGGAAANLITNPSNLKAVSMPHAALWVVQPSSLAALVPLGRKSPFGKSPEI